MNPQDVVDKVVANAEEYTFGRPLALVAVVGSHNYGLADEKSDVDLKVGYFPVFKDYFDNSFPMTNQVTFDLDYTTAPVHHLVEHSLKGNINFMEPWMSPYSYFAYGLNDVALLLNEMFRMNVIKMALATRGMALTKYKNMDKYSEKNASDKELYGYNRKEAAHAMRCLLMVRNLVEFGELKLKNFTGCELIYDIRNGNWPRTNFEGLYKEVELQLNQLLFEEDRKTLSKRLLDVDKTKTDEFKHYLSLVNSSVFKQSKNYALELVDA